MNEQKNNTILVIEDANPYIDLIATALSPYYNIIIAKTGTSGIINAKKHIPSLILLDINLPETTGQEVIVSLKNEASTKDIPVIFLTSSSSPETQFEALSLGAVDYITKPFHPKLLYQRVETHLIAHKKQKELTLSNENLGKLVDEKTKTIHNLQKSFVTTFAELIEHRDEFTLHHVNRTTKFIKLLIEEAKNDNNFKEYVSQLNEDLLVEASQLHDIGKIFVSDSIISKPSKLTEEEFAEIKKHPALGGKVIEKISKENNNNEFLKYAKSIAETHHEKWDGTGYPNKLKGYAIPLEGRLMAIADVYDALVSKRPYKDGMAHEKAVEIIVKDKGTHFDPIIVDLFSKINHKFKIINASFQ